MKALQSEMFQRARALIDAGAEDFICLALSQAWVDTIAARNLAGRRGRGSSEEEALMDTIDAAYEEATQEIRAGIGHHGYLHRWVIDMVQQTKGVNGYRYRLTPQQERLCRLAWLDKLILECDDEPKD